MSPPPLSLPIHFAGGPGDHRGSDGSAAIPFQPLHLATWMITTPAGPSRRTAAAGPDNSLWITTSSKGSGSSPLLSPATANSPLPTITTTSAPSAQLGSSTTSPVRGSRPSNSRHGSYTRPRAGSTASSVITTTSGRRKVSTFSPPPSSRQLASTTLTSVVATSSSEGAEERAHRSSVSEKNELREQLREQGREREEAVYGLGISHNIAGLTRRGVQGVTSHEAAREDSLTGAQSPRSVSSFDSGRTGSDRTVSGRWAWLKGGDDDGEKERESLKERMHEVEVEREMEREVQEEDKEQKERRVVEKATRRPSQRIIRRNTIKRDPKDDSLAIQTQRLVLPQSGTGKIVQLAVFDKINVLAVLRDVGIVDLVQLDTLKVSGHINLEQPEPRTGPTGSSSKTPYLSSFWLWQSLHLAHNGTSCMVFAEGIPWPSDLPSPNGEVTRVVAITQTQASWGITSRLELPGQGRIAICRPANESFLLHFLQDSLTSYPIIFPSTTSSAPATGRDTASPSATSPLSGSGLVRDVAETESLLPQAQASAGEKDKEKRFTKFLAKRPPNQKEEQVDKSLPGIGEGVEVERNGYAPWTRVVLQPSGAGAGVSGDSVDVFSCDGRRMSVKSSVTVGPNDKIREVAMADEGGYLIVSSESSLAIYERSPGSDDQYTPQSTSSRITAMSLTSASCLVVSDETSISVLDLTGSSEAEEIIPIQVEGTPRAFGALAPTSSGELFVSDGKGNVTKQDLLHFLQDTPSQTPVLDSDRLDSPAIVLKVVNSGQGELLVAGDEDGVVRIWTVEPFSLQGSWTLFADPVSRVCLIDEQAKGPLSRSLLCVSVDGTVGIISLEDMEQLFLIPASRVPLRRIFIDDKNILLAYANGKARVWNVETCEFRRSTGLDAAEDMLQSGNWVGIESEAQTTSPARQALTTAHSAISPSSDLGRSLLLNLRDLKTGSRSSNGKHLDVVRPLLSLLLPTGVDSGVGKICRDKLGIQPSKIPSSIGALGLFGEVVIGSQGENTCDPIRQLGIIALLRSFLDEPDLADSAAKVIAYYASGNTGSTGSSLEFFAQYYMDPSHDVHLASRMLFEARLEKMSEGEIEAVISAYQDDLPVSKRGQDRNGAQAAKALTMIGAIALFKYQSLSPGTLKSTAESISVYLSNATSPHLALAIELASKGFSTWQTYLDPMDLLRLLFHLSTHTPPSASLSAQSRLAVLHVASSNPALFMSTLSMDILDAKTVEGRTSIMKLCVFMARKKPQVLENGLPRIAEAVVKSLDPNIGKMRDDVWEAATVILNELVLAFSTIDFHSGTQRLAVGTHEGALIMYDLKTASRLYVLEPHKKAISSVNFSPDGRRLLTVSLNDGDVTVWKVGSSLSGFFNVGGPPRQGGERGEPFKRIVFKRADDGPLAETSALSDVHVEWPGNRQARVKIRETALTFET